MTMLRDMPRRTRVAAVVGVAGLAACAASAVVDRASFFQGWLVAWLFLVGIALASMAQVMIHELTAGDWGRVLRPPLEAATATLPLLALLAVPLAFGLPDLFAWARPDAVAHSDALQAQAWWLTPPRFIARNALFLLIWSGFALALVRRRAATGEAAAARARRVSVAGLLVYLVTVTLAAFDWIASLVPGWASTALGVRLGTAQFLASLAFAVPFVVRFRPDARDSAPRRDFQDFGNLLLTYAMMWAYIAFTQYLIVWGEDLLDETSWFWPRATTSWRWLVWLIVVLEFVLPVLATLFRAVKRNPVWLATVCGLVLAGQWLDMLWLVAPSLRTDGFSLHLADALALVGQGGVWLACVFHLSDRIPAASPRLPAAAPAHG
jgi:hypothetical protein